MDLVELANVIGGFGIRVLVSNGSLMDVTLNVKSKISIQEINDTFEKVSKNELKNILF